MPAQTAQPAAPERKSPRYRVGTILEMLDKKTAQPIGRVMNLSKEGFMLLTKQQLNFNERLDLVLQLPEPVKFQRTIELVVECRWCQPSNTSGYFGAGFSIESIALGKRDAWDEFLEGL